MVKAFGEYRGDPLYHASLSPDEYTALLDSIGFEVIAHAVEDWQTGGGRTVWLTRVRANRVVQNSCDACIEIARSQCDMGQPEVWHRKSSRFDVRIVAA
jgi:hypothetical protein